MIYGIGTDICDIRRMEKACKRFGVRFATRILSLKEERHMPKLGRAAWLAKRFAGKEAMAKAMGTGFSEGLSLKDISVINNKKGAPEVVLSEKAQSRMPPGSRIFISLSDEKGYALAFVVIEQNSD